MDSILKSSKESRDEFLRLLAEQYPLRVAAQSVGVGTAQIKEWRELYADFNEAITRAMAKGNARHIATMKRHAEENWQAQKYFGKIYDRDTWGDEGKVTIDFSTLSPDEIDQICDGDLGPLAKSD